jgi:glycosyltransferase involved in cell wall biosynthesis
MSREKGRLECLYMSKLKTLKAIMGTYGVKGVLKAAKSKLARALSSEKAGMRLHVRTDDIVNCRWDTNPRVFQSTKKQGPYTFNWVMGAPGKGSGGHQNLFRFIKFLEDAGHKCRIYLYTSGDTYPIELVKNEIDSSFVVIDASLEWLDGEMAPADAIFATGWETCYPVYNQKSDAKRFYFVQDFEPYFHEMGSAYVLAENTYKFGFTGITAGKWLTHILSSEYKMKCDSYDFGVDTKNYSYTNEKIRNKVFFYARPITPRRGFELGVMALTRFHQLNPNVEIVMAGWDVSNYEIPFPYTDLAVCGVEDLSDIYNECAAALILSFSNMSLLPLELLSAGVIPVINKGPNNEMVSNNSFLHYCEATPESLAFALNEVLTSKDQIESARKASESVADLTWEASGSKFISIVEREMRV